MAPYGSQLDPIWIQMDPTWIHLDFIWIPSGSHMDPYNSQMDPFGSQIDPIWIHMDHILILYYGSPWDPHGIHTEMQAQGQEARGSKGPDMCPTRPQANVQECFRHVPNKVSGRFSTRCHACGQQCCRPS